MRHTHTEIGIVVRGKNEGEARAHAEEVLNERLTAEGAYYDYGHVLGEERDDHAGSRPFVRRVDSPEGQAWLKDATASMRQGYHENLKTIRAILSVSPDDDLWMDRFDKDRPYELSPHRFRHVVSKLSGYDANYDTFVFDSTGNPLFSGEDLDNLLNTPAPVEGEEPTWLVLADVHS